jgi:hypothetical protein
MMKKQVKSKPAKMQEKEAKMKEKKDKLVSKLKARFGCAVAVGLMAFVTGCQNADPASRSNHTQYGDLEPRIVIEGCHNTVNITIKIGDGLYASADGGGDAQTNSPTQTTDTKPEVAVGVGGGSAGTGGSTPNPIKNLIK